MQVRLEKIQFNHDPTSAGTDAYNIRKNETTFITLPEWQFGKSTSPEDSRAAYSLSDTRDHVLTLKAKFSTSDTVAQQLSIRAVDASVPSAEGNVLGEVAENTVVFANGSSDFTLFELRSPRISSIGIGIHDIVWRWQYRIDASSPWTDFGESSHRIYTTLGLPTLPWVQQPFDPSNKQLVWTDILDYACAWAKGVADEDEAAASIVKEVFKLGPNFFQFDDKNHGHASYSDARFFDCMAFLLRLAGYGSNGRFVNCTDCASIVSTFANALGASLSQARMGPPQGIIAFPLKAHMRIGLSNRITISSFRYHEVAWKGECGEVDDVFDACLLVNGNNPHAFTVQPASNLPFGRLGEQHYRFSLVLDGKESCCVPLSGTAVRRLPGAVPQGLQIPAMEDASDLTLLANDVIRGFSFDEFQSPDFKLQRQRDIGAETEIPVIQSFWRDKNHDLSLIRIDAYECRTVRDARAGLSHLLGEFELPGMELKESDDRVLTFANSEYSTVLFAVANMVFLLRNVESATSRLSGLVTSLREFVLRQLTADSLTNQPTLNVKENKIMSVFDGDWHGYIESADDSHQLEPNGGFHLRVNPDSGDLVESTHGNNAITGTVNHALQSIVIHETDAEQNVTRFEGSLVYQGVVGGERFLACGRFILKSAIAEDQLEGTWVITKP
jgi:hypothetical protein